MADELRHVLVMINPRSGFRLAFSTMRRALDRHWDRPGTDLYYQFCQNAADGSEKAWRAVAQGVDVVLVAGGDGTINSIGRVLTGTGVALGVIPGGSGNGFARHFGIPLAEDQAVERLAEADVQAIDVGVVNEQPFFVTCSMAWDAAVVRSFDKMPFRGILPYVFAGVQEFFEYRRQPFDVEIDGEESRTFADPMVFTIANLTQYGGGAKIAPRACPDDGLLELVVVERQDAAFVLGNLARVFDGSIDKVPEVVSHSFRSMTVHRPRPAPIQIDGELVDAPADVTFRVNPAALKVLVPRKP